MTGLRDTIAVRSMASMVVAMAIGAILVFSGQNILQRLGHPKFPQATLVLAASEIIALVQTAPLRDRVALAGAASNPSFRVDWYPSAPVSKIVMDAFPFKKASRDVRCRFSKFGVNLPMVAFYGDQPAALSSRLLSNGHQYPHALFVLVGLSGGDWLEFTVFNHSWMMHRLFIALALMLFCGAGVVVVQARLLTRPMERFTEGIQRLGADLRGLPISEEGPLELRAAIAAANAMQTRIRSFVDQRTLLFASISHDLRTPLTRMRLHSEKIDGPTRGALLRNIDEMSAMVEAALSLFNNEEDQAQATTIDVGALVQLVADDFSDQGMAVAVRSDGPHVALAKGEPRALRRAIDNVVGNALQYAWEVEVCVSRRDHRLLIIVSDRGPSLHPDRVARLFEPFQRFDGRAENTRGMGLGLASVQYIMNAHGGTASATRRIGGGLEVTLSLPLDEPSSLCIPV